MTENRNLKRAVRARAARTGESYTAALRQVRGPDQTVGPRRLRLAVAQSAAPPDPRDTAALRAAGAELRALMREARAGGARLVHFPEGATCCPAKRVPVHFKLQAGRVHASQLIPASYLRAVRR